jgi:hypothetical protein
MPRIRRPRSSTPAAPGDAAGRLLRDPEAARPWPSLVFLSPLLAFYAVGVFWVRPDLAARADLLVRQMISPLGVTGVLVPTWLVVGILMLWHLVRGDTFRVRGRLLRLMALETVLLALPLLGLHEAFRVILRAVAAAALAMPAASAAQAAAHPGWIEVLMTSIGAGIYEELLFRLLLIGVPLALVARLMKRKSAGVTAAVVLIAAAVFAGAHTMDHPATFTWGSFLFRTAAGTYLGYIFARRGFGVVAGVHIAYDWVVTQAMLAR